MTIASTVTKVSYDADGTTRDWPITFETNGLVDAEVEVYVTDSDGISTKITANYDVDLTALSVEYPTVSSGLAPIATGNKVLIVRSVGLTQDTDYKNQGSLPAETIEQGLDRLTMVSQQVQEELDRCYKSDISEDSDDTISASIITVAGISANVTTVAGISSDVTSVAAIDDEISTVEGISANVTTVAGISANVTTVAGISSDVTSVAAIDDEISTVEGISANVTTVAGISANVTTVAGISSDVTSVAAIDDEISTVEGISANVTTVAGISANVTTVAGISSDVTSVAAIDDEISTVEGISANVTTVAGISANVTTVAGYSTDIQTCADNMADINTVADNIGTIAEKVSGDGTVNPTNLVSNGNFEAWSAGRTSQVDVVPTMTSNTAPSGVASAKSEYDSDNAAWKAFDNVTSGSGGRWSNNGHAGEATSWLQYQFTQPRLINKYTVTGSNASEGNYYPTAWTLQASNTGAFAGEQVTLDTQTAQSFGEWETKTYTFTNNSSYYTYYRLNLTAGVVANWYQIGEFRLFEQTWNAPDGWTLVGAGASVAKETSIVKMGSASAKLTAALNTDTYLYINNVDTPQGVAYLKTRSITLGCWVWADAANRARIGIGNGVAVPTYSSYHTGDSTWQFLTVTVSADANMTGLDIYCWIEHGAAISAYFDGAMLVEGSSAFAFAPKPAEVTTSLAASSGAGSVKMGSANAANSAGWLKVKNSAGTDVYIPYWTTDNP